ncbi:uncharacterized protein N7483_000715 [Penicillium malachiteum]|uniref:uncharacterized protein n=1 Tax=Penicillium malachiteum TaxID=1324776 RepID=UPI0025493D6D|nr:uncharacterized protein N7483_000715 [Penicillium malachiteum]KAJ5735590.1 hypothetical protein N7483_000715 [Penicillium malachiteum]
MNETKLNPAPLLYLLMRQSHTQPQAPRVSLVDRNQKFNFMSSCALPYYDKVTGKVERGISFAGCQLAIEKNIVTTASTKFIFDARDKVYARDGFLDHFKWCEQAQILWKSSAEGAKKPTEIPLFALMEGHFQSRE